MGIVYSINAIITISLASKFESIMCVLWDSTLLRFYDVAKHYAVKREWLMAQHLVFAVILSGRQKWIPVKSAYFFHIC